MGKTKVPKKQTSTISARQAIAALQAGGFKVEQHQGTPPQPRPTERGPVAKARAMFGPKVKTSQGGHTVTLSNDEGISVFVPHQGMLGHGAVANLQEKTGLTFKS